ncbi:MAG: nuclear transport factor 2 family protein [Thermodesulfobacteriota bacterium]
MKLTKGAIKEAMAKNGEAWDRQDLEGVLELYHDEVYFENWTGGNAKGKEALRQAWTSWFNSGGRFLFRRDDTFVDEGEQKLTVTWELEWPSTERGYEGKMEKRRGLDVIHFQDGKIIRKMTYSKTTVEIDGQRVKLTAQSPKTS